MLMMAAYTKRSNLIIDPEGHTSYIHSKYVAHIMLLKEAFIGNFLRLRNMDSFVLRPHLYYMWDI